MKIRNGRTTYGDDVVYAVPSSLNRGVSLRFCSGMTYCSTTIERTVTQATETVTTTTSAFWESFMDCR